jgi:hypothetical protein
MTLTRSLQTGKYTEQISCPIELGARSAQFRPDEPIDSEDPDAILARDSRVLRKNVRG